MNTNTEAANEAACYSTNQGKTNMWWMALYETFKAAHDPAMFVPTPILFDCQNPTKQSWYPTNAPDYDMNNRTLSYYPAGRSFANVYGLYFQAASGNRAPTNAPDVLSTRVFASARMGDFYPEFTYGPPPTNIFNLTNALMYPRDVARLMTNTTNGVYYQMYSFKDMQWKSFLFTNTAYDFPSAGWDNNNLTKITTEGNWLTMMQAWIARKEQNAQIYFVNFSDNNSFREKRQIANDRTGVNGNGISPWFPDQPVGGFYDTTNQTTLNAAFDDIARKISARLTR